MGSGEQFNFLNCTLSLFLLSVLLPLHGHHVSAESCATESLHVKENMKNNMNDPTPSKSQSCGKRSDYDGSQIKGDGHEFETGIEFLMKDRRIEPLFDSGTTMAPGTPVLTLVQMFIRNVKGLETKQEVVIFGGETGTKSKPDWCFYPFLLKDLVKVELKIYGILKEYYLNTEANGTPMLLLESYINDVESSTLRAKLNVEAENQGSASSSDKDDDTYMYISSHLLLVYRMIRRFAEDLQPIFHHIVHQQNNASIIQLLHRANPDYLVFPNSRDLQAALEALLRTQHGNDINTYDMSRGIFEGVDTGIHLNALHSLELAAYYLKASDFDYAIQWFYHALETVKKSPAVIKYPKIKEYFEIRLGHAIEEHNRMFAISFNQQWNPGVFNTTVTVPFKPDSYIRRIVQLNPAALLERTYTHWNWAIKSNFRRVCAGENLQTEWERRVLKCWYHRLHNKYWIINPLKIELLSESPLVVQIYDFIGDTLIEKMKIHAQSQLERSLVVDRNSSTKSKVDSSRTSAQTWVYDDREEGSFLRPLTKSLELMSGLTISPGSASDAYQIACYGSSHHYDTHIDSFEDLGRTVAKGNRITTIMGYLNDVKVGGRTGFPVLGTFAKPVKGSIVMWDNMKRNGVYRDERTWHGGCPVVLGLKWITNKWIYYSDNFLNFSCGLDPAE